MRVIALAILWAASALAQADVTVVSVLKEKALLSVNGAMARVYPVGATLPDGSKLVAVSGSQVTLEENGKRYTATLGQFANSATPSSAPNLVLYADMRGQYMVPGAINDIPVPMLVDTGASLLAIPGHEAKRMGIDYRLKGSRSFSSTANGKVEVWIVKVDRVRVGDVELSNLEASVHENGLPIVLLGSNVLNRFDMKREGSTMTLTRK